MAKKQEMACQVTLHRKIENGLIERVVWIPNEFAKEGKVLKIKDEPGNWIDGWVVVSTGAMKSYEFITDHERDYLTQRKFSDV